MIKNSSSVPELGNYWKWLTLEQEKKSLEQVTAISPIAWSCCYQYLLNAKVSGPTLSLAFPTIIRGNFAAATRVEGYKSSYLQATRENDNNWEKSYCRINGESYILQELLRVFTETATQAQHFIDILLLPKQLFLDTDLPNHREYPLTYNSKVLKERTLSTVLSFGNEHNNLIFSYAGMIEQSINTHLYVAYGNTKGKNGKKLPDLSVAERSATWTSGTLIPNI